MKKIGLICLAVVLALGVLGVGFAHWSQTIEIETTVETGSVNVEIVSQKSNDPGPHAVPGGDYYAGSLDPEGGHQWLGDGTWYNLFVPNSPPNDPSNWNWVGTLYDKNVASCDCTFTADTLTITIDNVYPSYGPDVAFAVQNKGTIPVKISSIKLTSVTTPTGTYPKDIDVDVNVNETCYMVANDGTVVEYTDPVNHPFPAGFDDDYAFSFLLTSVGAQPLLGVQIDEGNGVWGDVGLHVAQSALQGETYSFTIEYTFTQWNLVP